MWLCLLNVYEKQASHPPPPKPAPKTENKPMENVFKFDMNSQVTTD